MQETPQQFQLGVIECSLGIVKADERIRDVGGEGAAPKNRARGAIATANRAACTVEDREASQARRGGIMWEPHASRTTTRGIMRPHHGGCSGDEFGESRGSGAKMGMQPTEVVEGCMKTWVQAKTGGPRGIAFPELGDGDRLGTVGRIVWLEWAQDLVNGGHQQSADVEKGLWRTLCDGDEIVDKEIDRSQTAAIDGLQGVSGRRKRHAVTGGQGEHGVCICGRR
eukprot:scaffold1805_cov104-Cylindrotheca_fusiformis.AAC.3